MEKHLFKFGDSSLAFIIPKKWAVKHQMSGASPINVSEGSRGELIISSDVIKSNEAARMINKSLSPQLLARWIGLHYIYGTTKLTLKSEIGFSQEQLDAIEEKLGTDCVGFEVTSQSNSELTIEDFTNIKEMDLNKVITRLSFLIEQEFKEMLGGNPKTVKKIERRVNRFYMLGMRYVNMTQPKDDLRCYSLLTLMEQVSDSMVDVAVNFEKKSVPILQSLQEQFGLCLAAYNGNERTIAKVSELRKETKGKITRAGLPHSAAGPLSEIANSVAKIAEYGFMAEVTPTTSVAQP